jgi:pimeloyl-ACP methyl ester carboxylesterase
MVGRSDCSISYVAVQHPGLLDRFHHLFSIRNSSGNRTVVVFYRSGVGRHLAGMDERQPNQYPVAEIAPQRLDLGDAGLLPICINADLDGELPHVHSVLIMLHGRLRNAMVYYHTAISAVAARPGWLVASPQFLAEVDIAAHRLSPRTLRWGLTDWMGGDAAIAPSPQNTFAVLDALLDRLARRLPALRRLVVAGHSGGAQVAQRYSLLADEHPNTHYVIANPSSYAFLDSRRPEPTDQCPEFDRWKYGLSGLPDYCHGWTREQLAARYAKRRVTYLLGADDTDSAHPALDNTAAARCQGPHRRARGEAFYTALKIRFPDCRHKLRIVPGVGHDGFGIFTSTDGIETLFGRSGRRLLTEE